MTDRPAVIDGHPVRAAELAADHFSLTESMLRELRARVMLRSGPPQAGLLEAGQPQDGQPQDGQPQAGQPQE
jgi:hypothetical protein